MNTEDQQGSGDPWTHSDAPADDELAQENAAPAADVSGTAPASAVQPAWTTPPIGSTQPVGAPQPGGPVWPPSPGMQGQYPGYFPYNTNAGLVLTFAIISIFCCGVVLGPIAWAMSHQGLKQIAAGQANPMDRSALIAARICAIIGTILQWAIFVWISISFINSIPAAMRSS